MQKEHEQVSQVFDSGRRGAPLISCDCVVCFGYCCVDRDIAGRELRLRRETKTEGIGDYFEFGI